MKHSKNLISLLLVFAIAFSVIPVGAPVATAAQAEDAAGVIVDFANGGSVNLTKAGNVDWMHWAGMNFTENLVRKYKSENEKDKPMGILKAELLPETFIPGNDRSNGQASWSDGTPVEFSDGSMELRGFMLSYRHEGEAGWGTFDSGMVPEDKNSGVKVTVPASDTVQKLTFYTNLILCGCEVLVYAAGSDELIYRSEELATKDQNRIHRNITVTILPGAPVDVLLRVSSKSNLYGSVSVGSVTLGREEMGDEDYAAILREEVTIAEGLVNHEDIDNAPKKQLISALELANSVLSKEPVDQSEAFNAHLILSAAILIAQKNVTAGLYANEYAPSLTASFGWEGDYNAPYLWIDGTYRLRDNGNKLITFGVTKVKEPGAIHWTLAEGYLPCYISKYGKNGLSHKIENFADEVYVNDNRYVVAYSRMTTTNNGSEPRDLPSVSGDLVPLNEDAKSIVKIAPGETVVRDYCIGADRFGGNYAFPAKDELAAKGSFDEHYSHMKGYWNGRLEEIFKITSVPDKYSDLINAYKAGFIFFQIIKDGDNLNVGENAYDGIFDHDAVGQLAFLVEAGDTSGFVDYANANIKTIVEKGQYPDSYWKVSWPFALYLQKTGDAKTVRDFYEGVNGVDGLKACTHKISADRVVYNEAIKDSKGNPARIMKTTDAIDSNGTWVVDDWSALLGLTTYRYICDRLYTEYGDNAYKEESEWALYEYNDLLDSVQSVLSDTMEKHSFNYIPISMILPNELTARKNVKDGNWAAHYMFGRWDWDGYLFGAEQDSWLLQMKDQTYDYIIDQKSTVFDSPYNMGGYPGYSSGYNAGYFSAALAGEKYRDYGIKAYRWMIENSMSSPYGWWEGIGDPDPSSVWDHATVINGAGSCQHAWGQSNIIKVLLDSFLAEKSDGTIIAGRGLPAEFNADGETVEISNYICNSGKRIGFIMTTEGDAITFTLTGDKLESDVSLELIALVDNIESVSGGLDYDSAAGTVLIPAGTASVTVVTSPDPADVIVTSTIGTIVAGCAANLPADVSFSGEAFGFELGLYNPDGELLSAIDVSADGRYVFRLEASDAVAGTYLIKASGAGEAVSINCVERPDNLWKPVVSVDGDIVSVIFAGEVSFDESRKSITIDGAPVDNSKASVSGQVITVAGVTAAKGQTVAIGGVRYAELFPSYSFTFKVLIP